MKKSFIIFLAILPVLFFFGCNVIREYEGIPIKVLRYEKIDYNGGHTTNYTFDFVNNNFSRSSWLPGETKENDCEVFASFTEEQKREFINRCYSYGLFNLKENYKAHELIIDGGGWVLTIEYDNGTSKISEGSNAGPTSVFEKCAVAFYDLCGEGVVGIVPQKYHTPPRIDISIRYSYGDISFDNNFLGTLAMVNYKWNKFESLNNDPYSVNLDLMEQATFLDIHDYKLVLFTANYGNNIEFSKCVVKNYNINQELSEEKIVIEKGWFSQVVLELELNKIYVIELTFPKGDFVQYTFNTLSLNSKILFGEYYYSIYNVGYSVLIINDDATFSLLPFNYYNDEIYDEDIATLTGPYGFEEIDGQDYLCLYPEENKKIVFGYCLRALVLEHDKTTYNISDYNLNKKSKYICFTLASASIN